MDYKQTYAVKRNFQYLLQECSIRSCIDSMLDRLFSNELLENDEYEILIRMQLSKEKMRTLISLMLDKRGARYIPLYDVFITCLKTDMGRDDVALKLSQTYDCAPVSACDNLSLMSDDMHASHSISMTSFDSGHMTHINESHVLQKSGEHGACGVTQHATINYNNFFYSCPSLFHVVNRQLVPSPTHDASNISRKHSLDSAAVIDDVRITDLRSISLREESRDHTNTQLAPTSLPELSITDRISVGDTSGEGTLKAYDEEYPVVVVGSGGVGKTSLVHRFAAHSVVTVNDWRIKLQVSEFCEDVASFSSARGVVICYDVTRMETLLDVITWYDKTNRLTPSDGHFVLVGNKSDLPSRQVSTERGQMMANHLGIPTFAEVSAAHDRHIHKLLASIATQIQSESNNVRRSGHVHSDATSRDSRRSGWWRKKHRHKQCTVM